MRAPTIWDMNMDHGLLMVMCPVLKSCQHTEMVPLRQPSHEACRRDKQPQHCPNHVKEGWGVCCTCMRVAADEVEAMTKPLTPRPAITPPLAVPAHAANAKMTTCASMSATHLSIYFAS